MVRTAETEPRRPRKRLVALSALDVLTVYYGTRMTLLTAGKPAISVNHAMKYNRRTQPAGYDANDNAAPCYGDALAQLACPYTHVTAEIGPSGL